MAFITKKPSKKHGFIWRAEICCLGTRKSATFMTKAQAQYWGYDEERKVRESHANRSDLYSRIGGKEAGYSADEILSNRIRHHNTCGVYILFTDDKVTYVGQSKNVLSRIAAHSIKGRVFTSYFVIPCLQDELDKLEQHYIKLLEPPENRTVNPKYTQASRAINTLSI